MENRIYMEDLKKNLKLINIILKNKDVLPLLSGTYKDKL